MFTSPTYILHALMTQRYFAIFDEAVQRLKVVCMSEVSPEPEVVIMLSAYAGGAPPGNVKIMPSSEPEPMLKRIPLHAGKHVYVWRSPWCMYLDRARVWIPILDSTNRAHIPGDYIYEASYRFYNPWYSHYMSLRSSMLKEAERVERHSESLPRPALMARIVPSAPPAISQHKPPRHVAEAIKRDAIATHACCAISLDEITQDMKTRITPCFHLFHAESLDEWVSLKGTCPTCNASVWKEACVSL